MNGPRGSRFLWAVLLLPPVLLLAVAGAVSIWPQPIIDLANRIASINWSQPAAQQHRQPPPPLMPVAPPAPPAPTPLIRGLIRTPDGSLYEGEYLLSAIQYKYKSHVKGSQGPSGHGVQAHGSSGSGATFTVTPANDRDWIILNWIIVDTLGYAPGIIGPIASDDLKLDAPPIEFALQKGFSHRVRVVDAEGAPIPRALVQAGLTITPSSNRTPNPDQEKGVGTFAGALRRPAWTDEEGWAVFPQVRAETDYEFSAKVYDGSIPDDTVFVRPEPGVDTVITLPRSSTTGVVVDEDGRPSADAVLLIASEFDERHGMESRHPFERIIVAKSDDQGRFRLPSLHQESAYLIRVEGADDSLGFAGDVRAPGPELRVVVRKPRTVRGVVPPEWAHSVSVMYKTPTGFTNRPKAMGAEPVRHWWRPFKAGADGRFDFPVWDPSQVEFKIGGRDVSLPWPPPPDPIAFETPELPRELASTERTVRFKVQIEGSDRPDDPVSGNLTLQLANGSRDRPPQPERRRVEVRNGMGKFTCPRGDALRYDVDSLPGFWSFPGTFHASLGDPPMEAIHVIPARPIHGQVFDPDGSPANPGLNVSLRMKISPPPRSDEKAGPNAQNLQKPARVELHAPNTGPAALPPPTMPTPDAYDNLPLLTRYPPSVSTTTDAEGKFLIKAWPIGVPGQIVVSSGRSEQAFATVQVGPSGDSPKLKVDLPRTTTAEIHLIDPDGRPLSNQPLTVLLVHDRERRGWPAGTTDSDGRARIDGLIEGEEGYSLSVRFTKVYQTIEVPLKPGPPLELKAERGRLIEGSVVEAVTGWPIPKVSIYCVSTSGKTAFVHTETDDDGRFRIDTLPAGTYEIRHHLMSSGRYDLAPWPTVEAGSGRPVDMRVFNLDQNSPLPKRPTRP